MKMIIILMAFLIAANASATIINIPDDYATIQAGIDASSGGDTVLVQPGTYVENINFNGHNIVLGSLFLTTGDTSYIEQTVIDGNSTASVLVLISGEDSTTVITGFTIQNGFNSSGGGIYCGNIGTKPRIISNTIINNTAESTGGGIYCRRACPMIIDNKIYNNTAHTGAGISCRWEQANSLIENNLINSNIAYGDGGGIFCYSSSPVIKSNSINQNISYSRGGGIYSYNSLSVIILNEIISNVTVNGYGGGIYCSNARISVRQNVIRGNNSGDGDGGGIYCKEFSNCEIANNIIVENSAAKGGGYYCYNSNPELVNNTFTQNNANVKAGAFYTKGSYPIIKNTIFWGDVAFEYTEIYVESGFPLISYCNVEGGWNGEEIIDEDPLFRDIENNDYYLQAVEYGYPQNSACIDAGHPEVLDSSLSINWGLGTVISDIGAYGGGIFLPHEGNMVFVPEDYATIQQAINFSYDHDTIIVNSGMYFGDLNFNGRNVVLGSMFILTGDTNYINSTILEGSTIHFENREDNDAVISGFTIQHSWCGIFCINSDPSIISNIIKENEADNGAGINCENSDPLISRNIIISNYASGSCLGGWGGGINCSLGSDPIIEYNLIAYNRASFWGGGIFSEGDSPIIINNTFSGNYCESEGAGICLWGGSPLIVNNILWGDSTNSGIQEMCLEGSPIVAYCDIQDTLWPGQGNISANPLFCDIELNDFAIASNSPCADAGYNNEHIGAYGIGCEGTEIDKYLDILPYVYLLAQNYPNPFNAATTIKYELPYQSHVTIDIYDILGRKVISLINRQQSAGYHQVRWQADDFSSGMYFYKLQAGDFIESKKMLLLK